MKTELQAKLASIFAFKYYEVIGTPNQTPSLYSDISREFLKEKAPPKFSMWMKYLEEIGCRIVPKVATKENNVYIEDPCYSENRIEIPNALAEKVLVLGLP